MEGDRVNRATSPRARNIAVPGPLGSCSTSSSSSAEDGDDALLGVLSSSLSNYNSFKMNINDDFDSPAGHSSISSNSNSNLNNNSSNGGSSNSSGSNSSSNVSSGGDIESGSGLGLGLKQLGSASEGVSKGYGYVIY